MTAPRFLTDDARRVWNGLLAEAGPGAPFDPASADRLPEPIGRWLRHAIEPGTPARRVVSLAMHGTIRLGGRHPFRARQMLAPRRGFVWAATARLARVLPVTGFDLYAGGRGEMRWRIAGAVPIMSASGRDIARSAAGRLACEFVLAPATALDPAVEWHGLDGTRAVASVPVGDERFEVTLTVAPSGALRSVTVPRWGDPDRTGYGLHDFGVECEGEATFSGFTVPATLRGGWWPGSARWSQGEFIRFAVADAVYP
ncbi:DUF6544 family protein [Spongiactinospora sp. TRM90649]|uniref:DUF6544 family protein n=1 Tax=Spongiactinospora sp. TRM90649 TaxID=3031114 RepID=UPI0023F986DE|nr:DUF6544 family protein [Spongiactinospora sp. TRM90649]MDF5755062.1 hypothetical protein [Spongiactinospora sp. TRM90649]